MIKAGTRFDGPDWQYYILKEDLQVGDALTYRNFEPHNGAPVPVIGGDIPSWVLDILNKHAANSHSQPSPPPA